MWRLGCGVTAAAGLVAVWLFRAPLGALVGRVVGRPAPLPTVAETVGAPSPAGVALASERLAELARPDGPDSVVLTPIAVASWVGGNLDWSVRRGFDSLRVELRTDTLVLHARLDTRQLPADALGPVAGLVREREPLRLAGTLAVERPGTARFTVTELVLRDVRFPPVAMREVARRVAGADAHGAVAVPVTPAAAAVRVRPEGMTLYRRAP
jgi:hypothetical protein